MMVGHQFEDAAEYVYGLFVSHKSSSAGSKTPWIIAVWLSNNSKNTRHKVCDKILEEMSLPESVEIKWYSHANRTKFINLRNPKKKKAASSDDAASKKEPEPAPPTDD